MAQISISITKRTAFKESTQEFSNVYVYGAIGPQSIVDDFALAEALVDEVVAFEKSIHGTSVTFVRGRLWTSGGTQQENEMIVDKVLTGTGSALANNDMDKERAFLVSWGAGTDSRGRKVYLRKWFHLCASWPGVTLSTTVLANTNGFTTAMRATIANKADEITRIGPVSEWGLIADSGRERDGGLPDAHKFLEHHQLGDQWRQG